jgi:hypothetical protein
LFDSFKLVWGVNSDDGGVEGLVDVSSDLGLLDINTTLLLDEGGELGRGVFAFGQVVEVDDVLLALGGENRRLHGCFFVFLFFGVSK